MQKIPISIAKILILNIDMDFRCHKIIILGKKGTFNRESLRRSLASKRTRVDEGISAQSPTK